MHECNETRYYGWQDNRKMQNMWKIMHARRSWQIEKLLRCYRAKANLDGSRIYWGSIEKRERRLYRKRICQGFVEKLSSLKKRSFSREEKHIKMNATSKLLKQRSNQHVKLLKHLSTCMQSIHRSKKKKKKKKTHTLNKSNQFYISKTS